MAEEPRRRGLAFLLVGAAALVALALPVIREARVSVAPGRVIDRYRPLAAQVPADADELGFVTDAPTVELEGALVYEARYALAPRVVTEGPGKRYTVAFLVDPQKLAALCERTGLRPRVVLPNGACLLERRP